MISIPNVSNMHPTGTSTEDQINHTKDSCAQTWDFNSIAISYLEDVATNQLN